MNLYEILSLDNSKVLESYLKVEFNNPDQITMRFKANIA